MLRPCGQLAAFIFPRPFAFTQAAGLDSEAEAEVAVPGAFALLAVPLRFCVSYPGGPCILRPLAEFCLTVALPIPGWLAAPVAPIPGLAVQLLFFWWFGACGVRPLSWQKKSDDGGSSRNSVVIVQ